MFLERAKAQPEKSHFPRRAASRCHERNNSYWPDKKPFDLYMTQVSYKPERAKAVDFSKSRYFVSQTLVGPKGKPTASAKSIAGLKQS
jgi:hypothetical protein